jgi:hypothetical protein
MIQKVGARPNSAFFTHPYAWAPFVLIGDGFRAHRAAPPQAATVVPKG